MFWKRTLGVWLLGLGLAGLVQTVDNWLVVDRTVSGIHIYPQGTLDAALSQDEVQSQFGPTIHEVGVDDVAGIGSFELHFGDFNYDSNRFVLPAKQWQDSCDRLQVPQQGVFVITYRGLLFRLEGIEQTEGDEYGPGMLVDSEYLGRIVERKPEFPFAEMTPEQFAKHADIGKHLRAWAEYQGEGSFPGYVSSEVWAAFQDNVIGPRDQFLVAGTLYKAEEAEAVEPVRFDLPGLAIMFKIAAGICVILGVWFLAKPYRIAGAKKGVRVAGPGFAVFGDAVSVICTAVCAFMWLDALLYHGLGQTGGLSALNLWLFDDDLTTWDPVQRDALYFAFGVVGALMAPALAALVTQRSGQAIRATAEGVISDGGFGTQFIPWTAVDEVVVESDHMPTFRAELPATRRLQKKLVLRGEGCELAINEPSRRDTKQNIVRLLLDQAPTPIAEKVRSASRSW